MEMAKIACDICGGSLSMDASGEFAVCDLCGMKHTKDRIKAMAQEVTGTVAVSNIANIESLMKRGKLLLEDSDWKQANECFDKVLEVNPEYAQAYVGKLCAGLGVRKEELLGESRRTFIGLNSYQNAIRFADADYRVKLEGYNKVSQDLIEKYRKVVDRSRNCIAAGSGHSVGLKSDGTVVAVGVNPEGRCDVESWCGIVAVAAGECKTLGLKSNGDVVAIGEVRDRDGRNQTVEWCDIVEIAVDSHTVGLKSDGTVVAVGHNIYGERYGECHTETWRDIVAISAGGSHTSGLRSNGSVVEAGLNSHIERCGCWRDIIAIAEGCFHTIGLKSNGTVVATGNNDKGQCNTETWRDIVAIAGGDYHTIGLRSDGAVVAVGDNKSGQCNTKSWRDIIAVAAGNIQTLGLRLDGTVVASGNDRCCNTESWLNIGPIPEDKLIEWKRRAEQERAKRQQSYRWASQGLCRYCGGPLGGLLFKKCKSCGEAN
jgi:tetratricopeptide (TPR) repeat protein